MGNLLSAAGEPGSEVFADPSFWVNLGVAGVFLVAFAMGKVHPQSALDKVEAQANTAMNKVEAQTALAMQKLEQQTSLALEKYEQQTASTVAGLERQIERLIEERNKALAERDEMIEVMKNFTNVASGILQAPVMRRPPSPKRETR